MLRINLGRGRKGKTHHLDFSAPRSAIRLCSSPNVEKKFSIPRERRRTPWISPHNATTFPGPLGLNKHSGKDPEALVLDTPEVKPQAPHALTQMCDPWQAAWGLSFIHKTGRKKYTVPRLLWGSNKTRLVHSGSPMGVGRSSPASCCHLWLLVPISLLVSLPSSFQGRSWKELEDHLGGKPQALQKGSGAKHNIRLLKM